MKATGKAIPKISSYNNTMDIRQLIYTNIWNVHCTNT